MTKLPDLIGLSWYENTQLMKGYTMKNKVTSKVPGNRLQNRPSHNGGQHSILL